MSHMELGCLLAVRWFEIFELSFRWDYNYVTFFSSTINESKFGKNLWMVVSFQGSAIHVISAFRNCSWFSAGRLFQQTLCMHLGKRNSRFWSDRKFAASPIFLYEKRKILKGSHFCSTSFFRNPKNTSSSTKFNSKKLGSYVVVELFLFFGKSAKTCPKINRKKTKNLIL